MAGVPAARWWVEEPLDHTWHDAHPQVLLAGKGHSLGKELREWNMEQQPGRSPELPVMARPSAKAPGGVGASPGHRTPGSQGVVQSRNTAAAGNNSSCVCSDPCFSKDFLPTSVMWEAAQRSTVNSPRSQSRGRLHRIPPAPPAQDPSQWPHSVTW